MFIIIVTREIEIDICRWKYIFSNVNKKIIQYNLFIDNTIIQQFLNNKLSYF